ncbi:pyochelin synthetase [[Clostridium] polysaccharolyticum]|uniref:Pyochelin synthetase n=2 Tax=[Clostridium] polysaccharolyticum TaxID=29364 RepID=A0A1I0EC80_9FIRM|nr:pyochelin synthetase [[Clostridium] polysaccharolyticum]
MTVEQILLKYQEKGVTFYLEGDKLKFKGPKGIVEDQAKIEIKSYKAQIMEYLETHTGKVICNKEEKFLPFPLTDIQSAYLVGRNPSYRYGGIGCKIYSEFSYPALDLARLKKAWNQVIESHDMLHAVIMKNGTQQILEKYAQPDIKVWHMEHASEEELECHSRKMRERLANKNYLPETWPLYDLEATVGKDKTILHVSLDMLIADFTSIHIIINDLEDHYYGEETRNKAHDLSYRDIMIYKENQKKQPQYIEKAAKDREYWKSRMKDMPEGPELPVLEQEEKICIRQHNTFISQKRCRELSEFAKAQQVTLSGVILSMYAEVLRNWSRQKDFCINITMANRPDIHPEVQNVIGDFTVVDILQVKNQNEASYVERMKAVQKQLWEDLGHLSYTGVELLREMTRTRKKEIIIPYVYTSTLGLQQENQDAQFCRHGNLLYKITQTPQVLIDCQVMEYDGGILVNWDVREELFPEGLIEEAFEVFNNLLNNVSIETLAAATTLAGLPEKTMQCRERVNATKTKFEDVTMFDGFVKQVAQHPDREAVFCDGVSYSYREIADYANAVQKALLDSGCQKGDFVAIELKKSAWQIAAVMGTLLAGGAYLPVDMEQPRARKNKILMDSGARFLIASGEEEIGMEGIQVILAGELEIIPDQDVVPVQVDSDQIAYIIYTSGSTGNPKGVVINHHSAMNTIQDILKKYQITEQDKAIGIANLAFDLSVFDIFGMLTAGGSIVLPSHDKDIAEWCQLVTQQKVTIWNTVPAQMQMLVSYMEAEQKEENDSLRLVMLSGDWISVKLPKEIQTIFKNAAVVSLGGATEASIWSIYYEIDTDITYERSIPYGYPLANQEFYVLDKNLNPCPDWVKGDLYIGGEGLAVEYLGDQEMTDRKFLFHKGLNKRLYATGDCGRYLPGGVIEFMGREDFQVKIRGHRVELNEMEAVMNSYEDVEQAFVLSSSQNDDLLGAFILPVADKEQNESGLISRLQTISQKFNEADDIFEAKAEQYQDWVTVSNQTALYDIMKTFIQVGAFTDTEKWFTLEELYQMTGVHEYYKPLIRRWLRAVRTEGYVERSENGSFRALVSLTEERADEEWENWRKVNEQVDYSDLMMHFFEESRNNLLPMLRGQLDPVDLFFPQGKFHVALAAYKDNIVSRCMNKAVIEMITAIAKDFVKQYPGKEFRLLEVGAGVGGVSIDLIEALNKYPVKYLYTDISRSFLNEAQERFADKPWVEFALYDINEDYWNQNIAASSFDVILCNNVLHNANDELRVLKQFKEMSKPNGYVAVLDATGRNYTLLTSMEFHNGLNGVEDFRSEREQVFLSSAQWLSMFDNAGIRLVSRFPEEGNTLEILGQTLFIGRFESERKRLDTEKFICYMKKNLPDYMIPSYLEVMQEFPLTSNGKVDRKALQERMEMENPFVPVEGEAPETDLEKAVAAIWRTSLKREYIWRNENFYDAGGDSLLVAQVVAKMKENIEEAKCWEWDQLMIALIDSPTIEGLCKKLVEKKRDEAGRKEEADCLVVVKEEDSPKAVVFVHDGTGTKSPYDALIPCLQEGLEESRTSIYALVCNDMETYMQTEPEQLMQSLGEKYAHRLLETGKQEFQIIGYCMGGLIGIEISKVLTETGVTVYPLISIDTTPSRRMIDNEFLMERAFGMIIGADVTKTGHTVEDALLKQAIHKLSREGRNVVTNEELMQLDGEFAPVGNCYQKLAETTHEERLEALYKTIGGKDAQVLGYQKMRLNMLYQVFCHSFRAVITYDPGIYMGDAIVLSCKNKASAFLPVEEADNEAFWNEAVLGEVRYIPIGGTHLSCMASPVVEEVAKSILNLEAEHE